jgi:hypothetical protein
MTRSLSEARDFQQSFTGGELTMSRRTARRAALSLVSALGVLAIWSSAAFAAPIVSAEAPFMESSNIARLKGTVDPNGGGSTSVKVEYGKTKLYGKTSRSVTVSGTGPQSINIELIGIEEMSTYHYRVIAGSTTTSDALFESLVSWRVEGKRVSELEHPAAFEDTYKGKEGEGGRVEFRGRVAGLNTRIYCKQSTNSYGSLGVAIYGLTFNKGCYTQLNAVKSPACVPIGGITLHLNGALAQTAATTVKMGEECSIGETLTFSGGGYGMALPVTEASALSGVQFFGTSYTPTAEPDWESAFSIDGQSSPGSWILGWENAGKKFGIS